MGVGQSSPLKKGTQLNGRGLLLFFGAKPLVCQRVTILWTISFALELFLSPSDGGHINLVVPCARGLCRRGPHQDRYGDSEPLQLLLYHIRISFAQDSPTKSSDRLDLGFIELT
ncbi:hypothetical protein FOZ63_022231 [Perkinsus olseni]|uniref:Uncharacterized protein n=1 Tax=Perkinsus olseni TaxID=32597 RepID=A0A7J6TSC3_PEROL|nr:hypothetical protein FOZ63_022231 [Perkinsus olseni]